MDEIRSQMQFGIFTVSDITEDPTTGRTPPEADKIRDTITVAEHAEAVGLDVFALGEHHNPPFWSSSPTTTLAYIAARTERLLLTTSTTGLLDLDGWPDGMRVIVRRERPHPGAQLRFDDVDGYRLTAFATNTRRGQLQRLELRHRRRARCEDRLRNAKHTGLRNLPLHGFDQNRIWTAIVALASEITAWTGLLAHPEHEARRWEPKRLRHRLFTIPATLARHGRRTILHLSTGHAGPRSLSPRSPGSARSPRPAADTTATADHPRPGHRRPATAAPRGHCRALTPESAPPPRQRRRTTPTNDPTKNRGYSGLFKSFVDILDPDALTGMPVLIGANAGTPRHSLAIDYAIRPLFTYLHAAPVPTGVFAASGDGGSQPDGVASRGSRVDRGARELADAVARRSAPASVDPFDPANHLGEGRSFGHLLGGLAGE